jgi:hypothetical protein
MESRFVHIDEAVAMAQTLLPENFSKDKAVARAWAYMALRNIGPTSHWFATCVMKPNDNLTMKKPDDMWKAIDIALYDSAGCELRYSYKGLGRRIHSSRSAALREGEYSPVLGAAIDLSEDVHAFHLGSNGSCVAFATLKYLQLPIDTDGMPMIPEGLVLAIAFFIRWMWTVKTNENQSDREISERTYKMERAKALAESNMPSGIELEQIGKEWTSLIGAPQFKSY